MFHEIKVIVTVFHCKDCATYSCSVRTPEEQKEFSRNLAQKHYYQKLPRVLTAKEEMQEIMKEKMGIK